MTSANVRTHIETGGKHSRHSHHSPQPDLYVFVFKPLASSVPIACRLRRMLKAALRQYDLRCVEHKVIEPTKEPRHQQHDQQHPDPADQQR